MSGVRRSYPEHDKLVSVSDDSQEIYGFLLWLQVEKNIWLCTINPETQQFELSVPTVTEWLNQYFGIDPEKLAAEKIRMSEHMAKINSKLEKE